MILRTEVKGCLQEPYSVKDKLFGSNLLPTLNIENGDVDLEGYCTPVSNQLWLSSCVANASADAIELCNGVDGLYQEPVSRLQIYFNGRSIMTVDGIHNEAYHDAGMWIRSAFQAMNVFGICPEKLWEYKPERVNERPDIKATWYALRNKLHSYYKIGALGEDQLDEVKSAIRGKHPVVFGIPVIESFYKGLPGVVIPPPVGSPNQIGEKVLGRHAIMAMGVIGDHIKIRNSWGPDWCDSGYAILHQDWFAKGFASDLWVPTNGMTMK